MDYELRFIDTNNFNLVQKCRKIKLRKQSFSNIVNRWIAFSNQQYTSVSQVTTNDYYNITENEDSNDFTTKMADNNNVSKEEVIKVPIYLPNLENDIIAIEESCNIFNSIKRRALALNKNMYCNIINNTKNIYEKTSIPNSKVVNEEEIKQAVKDAFDQINFNKPSSDEIVISPEEVSNSVSENIETTDIDFNDSDLKFNINPIEYKSDKNFDDDNKSILESFDNDEFVKISKNEEPIFKFEDINLSNINADKEEIKNQNKFDNISNEMNLITNNNAELEDLLNSMKNLKIEKEEQERKTQDAHNLAIEKEKEKEKVKADFIEFQNSIKKDLDISKKQEQEELEKAKKAEEITNALIDIMDSNTSM